LTKKFATNTGSKCSKQENPRDIYLEHGKPIAVGPVTHMTKVLVDISSHRELATFQVANQQNPEVILGIPRLRAHTTQQLIGMRKGSHSTVKHV